MTHQVGLLGYPLSHSISPAFQQAALDHCSIPARYHRWAVPPEHLPTEVERLRGDDYLGANVTIPHKEVVAGLVDEVDEGRAPAAGREHDRQGRRTADRAQHGRVRLHAQPA